MNDDTPDLVEQLHRAAVQRCWEENERGRALVEQAHREAAERYRSNQKRLDERMDQLHREAVAQAGQAFLTQPMVADTPAKHRKYD